MTNLTKVYLKRTINIVFSHGCEKNKGISHKIFDSLVTPGGIEASDEFCDEMKGFLVLE